MGTGAAGVQLSMHPRFQARWFLATLLAGVVACDEPDPATISVDSNGTAVLAVADEGDPWRIVTPVLGRASFEVRGPYALVSVCTRFLNDVGRDTAHVTVQLRDPADEPPRDAGCSLEASETGMAVDVTVAGDWFTEVQLENYVLGPGATAAVERGVHDLVVFDGVHDLMSIERGFQIDRQVTLRPDASVARPIVQRPAPTVDGLVATDTSPAFYVTYATANGQDAWYYQSSPGPTSGVRDVPFELTEPGDHHAIVGYAQHLATGSVRATSAPITSPTEPTSISLSLIDPLVPPIVSHAPLRATWDGPGSWDRATLEFNDLDGLLILTATATAAWLGSNADGATLSIPDLTTIPGWQAWWSPLPSTTTSLVRLRRGSGERWDEVAAYGRAADTPALAGIDSLRLAPAARPAR